MKHLLVLVFTLTMSAACTARDPFVEKNARFLVTNNLQYDEVEIQIDDYNTTSLFKKSIFPGVPENFEVKISIKKPAESNYGRNLPTGPTSNSNDWTARISVRFRIVRTGEVTDWLTCTAGAKPTTRVYIRPAPGTNKPLTGCETL